MEKRFWNGPQSLSVTLRFKLSFYSWKPNLCSIFVIVVLCEIPPVDCICQVSDIDLIMNVAD